MNEKNTVQLVS